MANTCTSRPSPFRISRRRHRHHSFTVLFTSIHKTPTTYRFKTPRTCCGLLLGCRRTNPDKQGKQSNSFVCASCKTNAISVPTSRIGLVRDDGFTFQGKTRKFINGGSSKRVEFMVFENICTTEDYGVCHLLLFDRSQDLKTACKHPDYLGQVFYVSEIFPGLGEWLFGFNMTKHKMAPMKKKGKGRFYFQPHKDLWEPAWKKGNYPSLERCIDAYYRSLGAKHPTKTNERYPSVIRHGIVEDVGSPTSSSSSSSGTSVNLYDHRKRHRQTSGTLSESPRQGKRRRFMYPRPGEQETKTKTLPVWKIFATLVENHLSKKSVFDDDILNKFPQLADRKTLETWKRGHRHLFKEERPREISWKGSKYRRVESGSEDESFGSDVPQTYNHSPTMYSQIPPKLRSLRGQESPSCGSIEEPATHEPVTHRPATHRPAKHQPATHQPATHQPATHQRATHQRATHQRTTYQRATHQRASHQPATHQPTQHEIEHEPSTPEPIPFEIEGETCIREPTTYETEDEPATHKPSPYEIEDEQAAHEPSPYELEDEPATRGASSYEIEDEPAAHVPSPYEIEEEPTTHESPYEIEDEAVAHEPPFKIEAEPATHEPTPYDLTHVQNPYEETAPPNRPQQSPSHSRRTSPAPLTSRRFKFEPVQICTKIPLRISLPQSTHSPSHVSTSIDTTSLTKSNDQWMSSLVDRSRYANRLRNAAQASVPRRTLVRNPCAPPYEFHSPKYALSDAVASVRHENILPDMEDDLQR